MKKWTKQEFINKVTELYGSRYDLSSIEYHNSKSKISLRCKQHGEFKVEPRLLLKGQGCPHCREEQKHIERTTNFITRMEQKFGNLFTFAKTHYISSHDNVTITCSKHNLDITKPAYQFLGKANPCYKCGRVPKLTLVLLRHRAKEIYGDKYTYDNAKLGNAHTKITINCPQHGQFMRTPSEHIDKKLGCPICSSRKTFDTKKFLEKAAAIHGSRYDYSKVCCHGYDNIVTIICNKHGEFFQTPRTHLVTKSNCPMCAREHHPGHFSPSSTANRENNCFFYVIQLNNETEYFYKIGVTTQSKVSKRYTGNAAGPYEVTILHEIQMPLNKAVLLEQTTLTKWKQFKYYPKHKFHGHTECLSINPWNQLGNPSILNSCPDPHVQIS